MTSHGFMTMVQVKGQHYKEVCTLCNTKIKLNTEKKYYSTKHYSVNDAQSIKKLLNLLVATEPDWLP